MGPRCTVKRQPLSRVSDDRPHGVAAIMFILIATKCFSLLTPAHQNIVLAPAEMLGIALVIPGSILHVGHVSWCAQCG